MAGSSYTQQRDGLQSLAGDNGNQFHLTEKGHFGGHEARRQRERHRWRELAQGSQVGCFRTRLGITLRDLEVGCNNKVGNISFALWLGPMHKTLHKCYSGAFHVTPTQGAS
jgi:hypothetical protein